MTTGKRIFSLRYKIALLFAGLILIVGIIMSALAIRIARKAVIEKIEAHLTDKATDIAAVVDGRASA